MIDHVVEENIIDHEIVAMFPVTIVEYTKSSIK